MSYSLPTLAVAGLACALFLSVGPCVPAGEAENGPVRGGDTSALPLAASVATRAAAQTPVRAPEPEPALEPAPAPEPVLGPVVLGEQPRLSPITPAVAAHFREVAARSDRRSDDVFAKLGGSSVASRAFMQCISSPHVDLGEHQDLQPTIDFFMARRVQRTNSFGRRSLATHEGWSLRQGLGGRPPRVLREVRAMQPRYALAFFGGNDVQAQNPAKFAERLTELVDLLESQGVIPILGATLPRRDRREMADWAIRYNRVSAALAASRNLPFVDFHQVLEQLPRAGLARDGVHPNVYRDGRMHRPCYLTEDGLTRGQNNRNLMTLQTLDRIRRVYVEGEAAPDPDPPAPHGSGTLADPRWIERLPFSESLSTTEDFQSGELTGYGSCWGARANGPERVYRIRTEEELRVRLSGYGTRNAAARVYLIDGEGNPRSCVRGGRPDMAVTIPPGTWQVVVELRPVSRGRQRDEGEVLFVATTED